MVFSCHSCEILVEKTEKRCIMEGEQPGIPGGGGFDLAV